MFEVIQSLSDSLCRRVFVGTGSWSKESPGGSAPLNAFWERNAAKKLHRRLKKRPPVTTSGKLFNAATAPHAQPTNATKLSNASQLASLKTDGIKVLIASLPANYPAASILQP